MEWLLIPGIFTGLLLVVIWMAARWDWLDSGLFTGIIAVVAALWFCAVIASPSYFYTSRNQALEAEVYYSQVASSHIAEMHGDYVIVKGWEQGLWQAGAVVEYNSYLKTTRYWDSIPIIGSVVYTPPEYLKYVRVK